MQLDVQLYLLFFLCAPLSPDFFGTFGRSLVLIGDFSHGGGCSLLLQGEPFWRAINQVRHSCHEVCVTIGLCALARPWWCGYGLFYFISFLLSWFVVVIFGLVSFFIRGTVCPRVGAG